MLSEVVMGDQSQSESVRGNQGRSEPLTCQSGSASCNQRSSEAIKSEQLTCQSGSASCPPSSSSPASTYGKMRGRQGEHLHARRGPEEVQQRREHRGFPGA